MGCSWSPGTVRPWGARKSIAEDEKKNSDLPTREEMDSQICPSSEEFEPLFLRIETGTRRGRADEEMSG